MPDSFDMTTLFPSRRAPRSQNQSFAEFTNSEQTRKRGGRKKKRCERDERCGGESTRGKAANVREEEKSFQELSQSRTTLQWLRTPVGQTGVLLRKEITSLLRRKHFNCFVVSRSHLGPVWGRKFSRYKQGEARESSLETGKFSSPSYVLLIAALEMNILSNITL